ncbi:MAG: hypothetical protein WD851_11820 [Pirellulales bacterium]
MMPKDSAAPPAGENAHTSGPVELGLRCKECGHGRLKVLYTRGKLQKIIRRRECCRCGQRITTWERVPGQF